MPHGCIEHILRIQDVSRVLRSSSASLLVSSSLTFSSGAHTRLLMEQALPLKWCPIFLLLVRLKLLTTAKCSFTRLLIIHSAYLSNMWFMVYFCIFIMYTTLLEQQVIAGVCGGCSVLPSIPKACRPNKPSVQNSL